MNKTYYQQNADRPGPKPINWTIFLGLPYDEYTPELLDRAIRASLSWVTCACGQQDSLIPRAFDGSPRDPTLVSHGSWFHSQICLMQGSYLSCFKKEVFEIHRRNALDCLDLIQKRAIEIINRINQKPLEDKGDNS